MMAALALASLGRKQSAYDRPISMSAMRQAALPLSPVYPLGGARAAFAQGGGLPLASWLKEKSQTAVGVRLFA